MITTSTRLTHRPVLPNPPPAQPTGPVSPPQRGAAERDTTGRAWLYRAVNRPAPPAADETPTAGESRPMGEPPASGRPSAQSTRMPAANRRRLALRPPQGRQTEPGPGETRPGPAQAPGRAASRPPQPPARPPPGCEHALGRLGPGLLLPTGQPLDPPRRLAGLARHPHRRRSPGNTRPRRPPHRCHAPAGTTHRHPRRAADPRALTAQPDPALHPRHREAHPPRRRPNGQSAMGVTTRVNHANCNWTGVRMLPKAVNGQATTGAPPGTRTPNPRIKSRRLCVRLLPDNAWQCRFVRDSRHFAAVSYRELSNSSATSGQTWSKHGCGDWTGSAGAVRNHRCRLPASW